MRDIIGSAARLTMLKKENIASNSVNAALNRPVDSSLCKRVRRTTPAVYVNVPTALNNPKGIAILRIWRNSLKSTFRVNQTNLRLATMIEREDAEPDYMLPSLREVPDLLARLTGGGDDARPLAEENKPRRKRNPPLSRAREGAQ